MFQPVPQGSRLALLHVAEQFGRVGCRLAQQHPDGAIVGFGFVPQKGRPQTEAGKTTAQLFDNLNDAFEPRERTRVVALAFADLGEREPRLPLLFGRFHRQR